MAREELEITYSLPSITTRGDLIKSQERQIRGLNSTLLESCKRINDLSEELNDIKSAIIIHPYSVRESIDMIKDMKEFMKNEDVQEMFRRWKERKEEENMIKEEFKFKLERKIEKYEQKLKDMGATVPENIKMYERYRKDYANKLKIYVKNLDYIKLIMKENRIKYSKD